jgi:hypothetical protein
MFGRLLLRNSDALFLSLVVGNWPYLTRTSLNVRTVLALSGFYLVLRTLNALRKFREYDAAAAIAARKDDKREFVDNPDVVRDLAKLAGFAYVRWSTPYLGKWAAISGNYEGAAESLRRDSIHVSLLLNDGQRINLRFAADRAGQLRRLQVGQRITAIGQIPIFGDTFVPENCELVRSEASPRNATMHRRTGISAA